MIFTPNDSNNIENKFGRNIQALTFALPKNPERKQWGKWDGGKSQKIFESWETIALIPIAIGVKQQGKSSEIHFDLTR